MDGSPDDAAVSEFLSILDEHRAQCEAKGDYVQAQLAKKRLEELRSHEESRRKEAVRSRHLAERLDVEEAHMLEFESFKAGWQEKMDEYANRTQELVVAMKERHSQELGEWRQEAKARYLLRPKFSKALLNERRIQAQLAKQRDYIEAQKVQAKADEMERWELEDMKKDWRERMAVKQAAFVSKQNAELAALKKRIKAGKDKQKRVRHQELDRLLRRYQNVKADLERQQKIERITIKKMGTISVGLAPNMRRFAGKDNGGSQTARGGGSGGSNLSTPRAGSKTARGTGTGTGGSTSTSTSSARKKRTGKNALKSPYTAAGRGAASRVKPSLLTTTTSVSSQGKRSARATNAQGRARSVISSANPTPTDH